MKYFLALMALCLVQPVAAAPARVKAPVEKKHDGTLSWEANWKAATAKSKATGKPIMLDFGTDWCTWCKKLDRDVFQHPAVISQLSQRLIFLKVNPEKSEMENNLSLLYKARGYPAVVVIGKDQKIKGRIDGYQPPERFLVNILEILR